MCSTAPPSSDKFDNCQLCYKNKRESLGNCTELQSCEFEWLQSMAFSEFGRNRSEKWLGWLQFNQPSRCNRLSEGGRMSSKIEESEKRKKKIHCPSLLLHI
mmetsp:Transcript_18634/g.40167  ORF Transcript_18634/g.40167 Transcript_18634/m.40167 type:complete len:101 (+) Transcript_18634:30-332(+)